MSQQGIYEGDLKIDKACDICGETQLLVYMKGSWVIVKTADTDFTEFNKINICGAEDCKRKAKNKAFL
jgi:hypothetical protein